MKDRFDPIDLAILPIGPIHPREFMRSMHEDGYEALNAFADLGAKYMLPVHFNTFVNSTDDVGEDAGSTPATSANATPGTTNANSKHTNS